MWEGGKLGETIKEALGTIECVIPDMYARPPGSTGSENLRIDGLN